MGSSPSKAATKTASQISATAKPTARKYPTRSPPTSSSKNTNTQPARPSPTAEPEPRRNTQPSIKASSARDEAPNLSSADPALSARLQSLGPATHTNTSFSPFSSQSQFQPSPSTPSQTIFPTPSSNPAVSLLTARYRIAAEADREFEDIGRRGAKGRSFLDVVTLRQVLVLRERGVGWEEIERRFELRGGVVGRLGGRGVVSVVG